VRAHSHFQDLATDWSDFRVHRTRHSSHRGHAVSYFNDHPLVDVLHFAIYIKSVYLGMT
jgi:hypothetical protein